MSSESLPKEFEKTTEVLPITKYGISSYKEFRKLEQDIHHHEWLKKAGLSDEEIKLYQENEAGTLDNKKIESSVLKGKLEMIYKRIHDFGNEGGSSKDTKEQPSVSSTRPDNIFERLHKTPLTFYPEGHPMNELKEIEEDLFGHLKNDDIIPITKRRKMLRRLERKKQRILSQHQLVKTIDNSPKVNKPGSLWDLKEMPVKLRKDIHSKRSNIIGPKRHTMYTIKDNKIVRLEPVKQESPIENEPQIVNEPVIEDERQNEYRAVDIVIPINSAEEQLLEGTKMSVDDIRKIERFKDYEPGIPSKVLYLKNIAPAVSQEQLSLLFIQFALDNGGPVDVRLMAGRMRGQAFVAFQNEDISIRALEEVNGTILSGRPIIAEFGRNTNRILDDT